MLAEITRNPISKLRG